MPKMFPAFLYLKKGICFLNLFLISYLLFDSASLNAQSIHSELQSERLAFEHLTDNQRIDVFVKWLNESALVALPDSLNTELNEFANSHKLSQQAFEKGILSLRIIFNTNLSRTTRIIACEFLEKIEDSNFYPIDIVKVVKLNLSENE
jgi:gamma-glutamylcysteine synthetase